MRLRTGFQGDTTAGQGPRVGLAVAHAGWRGDLERALVSAGCRVVPIPGSPSLEREAGIDVFVGDAEAAPASFGFGEDLRDRVVVWSADPSEVRSGRAEAGWDVLAKPFSVADLERALERVLAPTQMDSGRLDPVLASRDPSMMAPVERARRLAERDLDLVIEGELGVGRRVLARATHDWSPRAEASFVVLDRVELAALPAEEAVRAVDRAGAQAIGGSLVVLEPAEWTPLAQHALAAALRSGADNRVVTLVSEALETSVERGRLARELADRLDVARVRLPALRSRAADHRALCEAVARRVARRLGRETPALDESTIAAWAAEGFPGNLLGIESRIRAAMLQEEVGATAAGAPLPVRKQEDEGDALDLKQLERDTIVRALAHWQGNRTRASESLGISVRTLRNKIREYGLR